MTGRDLIIYILANKLEDERIFKDGMLIGFISVEEAAIKLDVGIPTIYALILQNKLDAIFIGSTYMIRADCELLGGTDD